jgi:hypothetical protein
MSVSARARIESESVFDAIETVPAAIMTAVLGEPA